MTHRFVPDVRALIGAIPPDGIVSRTVHDDPRLKVTVFGFAPGQELSDHTSSRAAVIEILAGDALVGLGDDRVEARAGAWVAMEPNLRHSVRAVTEVVMLLTLVKAPSGGRPGESDVRYA